MAKHPGRGGHAWRTVRAAVLAQSNICINCGKPINLELSGRHPQGPSVDHRIPISHTRGLLPAEQRRMALDPALLAPSHLACNSRRGNRMTTPRRPDQADPSSRSW